MSLARFLSAVAGHLNGSRSASAALRASEERFRDFAEAASDWLWEMGPDLRFSYFSDRIVDTLGIEAFRLLGKSRREIMSPEDIDAKWNQHLVLLERREPFRDFEYEIKLPDRASEYVRISGKPLFDDKGRFRGYRGVGKNITSEVEAARRAQQAQAWLHDAVESVAEGLLLFDSADRLVLCNSAYRRAVAEIADVLEPGLSFMALNRALVRAGLVTVREGDEAQWLAERCEQHRRCAGALVFEIKGERWIEVNEYRTQDGGTLILRTDITERKRAEEAMRASEEQVRLLMNSTAESIFGVDLAGNCTFCNPAGAVLLGYDRTDDLVGRPLLEFLHPLAETDGEALAQRIETTMGEAAGAHVDYEDLRLADGRAITVEFWCYPIQKHGNVVGAVVTLLDVTRRKQTEETLGMLFQAVEQSPVSVAISGPDGLIEYVNEAFVDITGLKRDEALGRNALILDFDAGADATYERLWQDVLAGKDWEGELPLRRVNGSTYWGLVHIGPVNDSLNRVTHVVTVTEDISLRKEQEKRILHQARYDSLTDLPNRVLAIDRLSQAIKAAARNGTRVALMFIDLDDFKKINDTLGHELGDELLVLAAERIRGAVRGEDTVARYGGDEFLVIAGGLAGGATDVEPLAEKVLLAFGPAFTLGTSEVVITPSVGLAVYPEDGEDPQTLLRNADAAMYQAKDAGRNTFHYFNRDLHHRSVQRLEVEHQLRNALKRDELQLHYQAFVDAASRRIVGAEALLRWQSAEFGLLGPAQFIAVAEQTGLIGPIGDWVLQEACRQGKVWHDMGHTALRLSVNVSPRQFRGGQILESVTRSLQSTGFPARFLSLEVTENLLIRNIPEIHQILEALHQLGLGLAMDDFGTGYSSLSYLKNFPFGTLKIDRSFVRDIAEDPDDRALVSAAIHMGKGLGLTVVAEGVETEEQLRILSGEQCDQVQGYLFGEPVSAADFATRWLGEATN